MSKLILLILLFSATIYAAEDFFQERIIFCLKKEIASLSINYKNGIAFTGKENLDNLLAKYQVTRLGRWLTSARETDMDGDVKLVNIYRAEFSGPKKTDELRQILNEFRRLPEVHYAHLEEIYRLKAPQTNPYTPNDTRFNEQWYLNKIMANYAWGLWDTATEIPGDSTIIIGIVDTGVDYDHPDIAKAMFWNLGEDINGDGKITSADQNGIDNDGNGKIDDFRGWDFAGTNGLGSDNNVKPPQAGPDHELSHGTHCGGIAAATSDNETGIASVSFSAKLIFTKHAADNDLTTPALYNTTDGMLYCAQMGAKIINCSFGSPGYSSSVQNTINTIVNTYGSIIVCAAGNEDSDNDINHHYPSDYNNTIGVAALTATDTKAYYSNYGEVIDISAPGGEGSSSGSAILSTIHWDAGGYEAWMGTSMSSPVVAGAFALLWAWFPNQSRSWIIDQLLFHADPVDDLNPSYAGQLGSGRVNVYNAIARNVYPFLTIESNSMTIINDNGNGELNPGESGSLLITLANDPLWLNAQNVSVTLSSVSPYITFPDASANYGNMAAGSSASNSADELRFALAATATLEPIPITVTIRANPSAEYPYEVQDIITVQPTLNQAGFPVLDNVSILLPVACDSLFGTEEKHLVVAADIGDDSLYVFNENGTLLEGFPVLSGYTTAAPIVADLDGDGQKEIVIANRAGTIKVIHHDGTLLLDRAYSEQIHGNAAVANMDGDLDLEIIFGTMSRRLHVINYIDGSELPGFPVTLNGNIQKGVAVGDLTGDGVPEIVFGLLSPNEFHVVTAAGSALPNFPITMDYRINTAPVIAHLKSTSTEHFIFLVTNNQDLKRIELSGSQTNLYRSRSPINSNLALCDINDDESLEILFGTDAGRLYAFNFGGDSLQNYPLHLEGKIGTAPVFADFDNDDVPEMVVATEAGYVYVLKNDGTHFRNFPASFGFALRGSPCIDDLDSDGDLEVLVGSNDGLLVLDVTGQKGSIPFWNTFMANNARTGDYLFEPIPNVFEGESFLISDSDLLQNYPNPFNPETTIQYTLSVQSKVELAIFNVLGQLVKTLVQSHQDQGTYQVAWDGQDKTGQKVVSGVYFYKLNIEAKDGQVNSFIKKMLLVR